MKKIKPFKAIRPISSLVEKVVIYTNNLMNDDERREKAKKNPFSFAHIVKPKLDFENPKSKTDTELFEYAARYFEKLVTENVLEQDQTDCYYVYRQSLNGRSQTGIIVCYHIDEYTNGKIKKHENTREEKEKENVLNLMQTKIQGNPIFLAYNPISEIDTLVNEITAIVPEYYFKSEFDVYQSLWVVNNPMQVELLTKLMNEQINESYIADGHHRAASMSLYSHQKKDSRIQKDLDSDYLMCCLFPSNQLKIFEYNRAIKDLNGLSNEELLKRISLKFEVHKAENQNYSPACFHEIGMYLEDQWYSLIPKPGTFTNDPVGILDVTILQENILSPILGITDPRTDKRIDFVAGTKGVTSLEKKVNKGKAEVAFALYPVSMQQLFDISDANEVMPPKSTWFEPKLLSGLIIYKMDN